MKSASKNELKKAILSKCILDCCCGERSEAKICGIKTCPLWPVSRVFFGIESEVVATKKVTKPKKVMSEAHKAAMKAGREAAKAKK